MNNNLKKLPMDVINKIFSLYYSPQSKELLEDIINYNKTLKIIKEVYRDFGDLGYTEHYVLTNSSPKKIFWGKLNPTMRHNFIKKKQEQIKNVIIFRAIIIRILPQLLVLNGVPITDMDHNNAQQII